MNRLWKIQDSYPKDKQSHEQHVPKWRVEEIGDDKLRNRLIDSCQISPFSHSNRPLAWNVFFEFGWFHVSKHEAARHQSAIPYEF
jgi:hypothetical protein